MYESRAGFFKYCTQMHFFFHPLPFVSSFLPPRASLSVRPVPTPPSPGHSHHHGVRHRRPNPPIVSTQSIFGTPVGSSSSSSYDPGRPSVGDEFVLVSLEEAQREVDRAINQTIANLFSTEAS